MHLQRHKADAARNTHRERVPTCKILSIRWIFSSPQLKKNRMSMRASCLRGLACGAKPVPAIAIAVVVVITIASAKPVSYSHHDHPKQLRAVHPRFPIRRRHGR